MRRLFRWLIGLLSALAVWKLIARRRARNDAPEAVEPDPAEELRQKLAETRPDPEPEPADDESSSQTIDERRADVHAKAREAIDSMQPDES